MMKNLFAALCMGCPGVLFAITIQVDTSLSPQSEAWSRDAVKMVEYWTPRIAFILDGDTARVPDSVRLVFRKLDGVAHAYAGEITISEGWIQKNPQDSGLVLHEMVHVIQRYPPGVPGWVVEGITDYVRFVYNESQGLPTKADSIQHYMNSYRVTAAFFLWVEKKYHVNLIRPLHEAARTGKYDKAVFVRLTGKTIDELWTDYVASF